MKWRLCWYIIILFIPFMYSQRFPIRCYANDRGLNTQIINDVVQDESGRIWAATDRGISVYDGYSWVNHESFSGKASESFRRVCCAKDNTIYAIPFQDSLPVMAYNGISWSSAGIPASGRRSGRIQDANCLNKGGVDLLLITTTGYGIRVYKNGVWFSLAEKDGLPSSVIYASNVWKNKCYITTAGGMAVYDGEKFDLSFNKLPGLPAQPVLAIDFSEEGGETTMYLLFKEMIGKISGGVFSVITSFPPLFTQSILDYYLIKKAPVGFFFGNDRQKWLYDTKTGKKINLVPDHGFSALGMTDLIRDSEGSFWFSSSRGLDKLANSEIVHFTMLDGMLENEVTTITEMHPGKLLIGHNLGLSSWDGMQMTAFSQKKNYPLSSLIGRVLQVVKSRNGDYIIAGGSLGVFRVDDACRITSIFRNDTLYFNSVAELSDGRILAAASKGTFILNAGRAAAQLPSPLTNLQIRRLVPFKDNIYLCCTQGGVFILNLKSRTIVPLITGRGQEFNIYALYVLTENHWLIGSAAGLYEYKNKSYSAVGGEYSFTRSAVYFIEKDRANMFWIGTNDGVIAWDGGKIYKHFTQRDGLIGKETNRGAICFDEMGRIWVGTEKALNCLYPELITRSIPVPKQIDIKVLNSSDAASAPDGAITFQANSNSIKFYVRAHSYYDEDNLQYEYKLAGWDSGWRKIEQREINQVQYENLKPGQYCLHVRACNPGGAWSKIFTSSPVSILPPFYATAWFYLLSVLLICAAVYLSFRITFVYRHRRVLEAEVENRTGQLRRSQEELKKVNDGLESMIAERTAELEEANKTLKEDLDIRNKMQAAIVALGQKYESIFKTAADPMLIIDAVSGKILDANTAASKMYGYSRDEFLSLGFQDLFEEPDYGTETLLRQTYHLPYCVHRLRDGSTRPMELTANYFRQQDTLTGVVNLRDISHFIDSEARLQEYNRALEELNSSKDKFFSIIAHDLKSPFHGLMGISEMLAAEFEDFDRETIGSLIARIHSLSKRLFQLVENLLNWSKLQTGRYEFSLEIVQPFLLVEEIFNLLKENYESKELSVVNNISPEHLLYANTQMTSQVFQNLIGNAVKFSYPGKNIILHSRKINDQYVEFMVADQGVGLSPEDQEKIFKIDVHFSTKGTRNEEGSGLGLLICKEMIEKHGGSINLTSMPGKGTNFTFTLPAYQQAVEQAS